MSDLKLHLLGPPQIEAEGVLTSLPRKKALALLAYLAITERIYHRETLAALFWPELDQSSALAQVRVALSSIRKYLGQDLISSLNDTIRLHRGNNFWLDVAEFQKNLFIVRTHHHPPGSCTLCRTALEIAIGLYCGDFMEGFNLPDCPDFDDWQFFMREGLRSDLAVALQNLTQQYVFIGDTRAAIPYARQWLSLDNLHEPAHCTLMRLYASTGQRSAALHQYSECEKLLQQELGILPQPPTRQLYQDILEGRETVVPQDTPILVSELSRPHHNLPLQTIPFIPREDVMPEILNYMGDPNCRLLNLVGPGGCGKTRLAIEAGLLLLDQYADGVFFVSLEPLASVDAIIPTIAKTLGFSFHKTEIEPRQQLLNFLKNKSLILILDNFEHLLEGSGLALEILESAPGVRILATSRTRLNVFSEKAFLIHGMAVPADDELTLQASLRYGSIQLFLQSARWAQAGFEITTNNLAQVIRICQMLEGFPLGILLAAAWLQLLPIDEISIELENGLDLLAGELRDLPERQRSLRNVFDRSWQMLPEREQQIFAALSIFRGGFTREAARQESGTTLNELLSLIDRSFLQRDSNGRFTMHRLLRQFATERLAENPQEKQAAYNRHCAYFASRLAGWENDLKGQRQAVAVAEMDIEIENCRLAWEWAAEQQRVDWLGDMLEGLYLYYEWRLRWPEATAVFKYAIERLSGNHSTDALIVYARMLGAYATMTFSYGELEKILQHFEQAEAILDALDLNGHDIRKEHAILLRLKGSALCDTQYAQEANGWLEKSLEIYRELNDQWAIGKILFDQARVHFMAGDSELAIKLFHKSIAACRRQGNSKGLSMSLGWISGYIAGNGQLEEAEQMLLEAEKNSRQIDDTFGLGLALLCLGLYVYFAQGKFRETEPLMLECVQLMEETGDQPDHALALYGLAFTKLCLGEYGAARTIFEKSLRISTESNSPRGIAFASWGLSQERITAGSLAKALQLCEDAVPLVRNDRLPHIEKAYLMGGLGAAACVNDQLDLARKSLCEALGYYIDVDSNEDFRYVLPAIALYLALQGQKERAVEIYAFSLARYPFITKARFMEDIYGQRIRSAAASLPHEIFAAAEERGFALDLWNTARELLEELK